MDSLNHVSVCLLRRCGRFVPTKTDRLDGGPLRRLQVQALVFASCSERRLLQSPAAGAVVSVGTVVWRSERARRSGTVGAAAEAGPAAAGAQWRTCDVLPRTCSEDERHADAGRAGIDRDSLPPRLVPARLSRPVSSRDRVRHCASVLRIRSTAVQCHQSLCWAAEPS